MKILLLFLLAITVGCNSIRDVSRSDDSAAEKIGRTICTNRNHVLIKWERKAVHFFKQQEYSVFPIGVNIDVDSNYVSEKSLISKGTKFRVSKVYYSSLPIGGSQYEVLAKVVDDNHIGILVNISKFYDQINFKNRSHSLKDYYASYCE